jgi:hypothetical protein
MVGPFGLYKCGPTPNFPRLLLSFIPPSFRGPMEKPGCTPSTLRKSPPILPVSSSSVTHQGRGHLRILCLSKQKSMVMRISKYSQARAFSGETRRGALVSNRGTWWLSGPPTLVSRRTVPC